MTIGELAKAAGVGVETVRYYQRRRLMRTPPRPPGGIRRYGADDLARLRFIRHAKAVGFSLTEIRELLALDDAACTQARALAAAKLETLRQRIEQLNDMAKALEQLVRACDSGRKRCAIIQSLKRGA